MGFFDRILRSRTVKTTRPAPTAGREVQPAEPGTVCEMEVDGAKYIMRGFELEIDKEGMSGSKPVAMTAVFDDRPAKGLESWIMRDTTEKDGTVKFFRNTDSMEEGALYSLSFGGALCTGYEKKIEGIIPVTRLRLVARYVNLSGEDYRVR